MPIPSSQSSLDPYVFFLDRNLGTITIANALRDANVRIEIHDHHFPPDAPDEDWLSHVGKEGWIVLTKDEKIRYRPNEKQALMQAGVGTFVVVSKNRPHTEVAKFLVRALPAISRFLQNHTPPFIAKINADSKVSMVDKE